MEQSEVTQLLVNGHQVGIIGLREVMEDMAGDYAVQSDEKVQAELVKRLVLKNYIPEPVREKYGRVFVREFRKFLGQPYEEEEAEGIIVKVLGAGCAMCNRLEKEVMELLAEMNLPADLEHVTDIAEIGKTGVMGTPALMINNTVVSVGTVPPKDKIRKWLNEAME
jgi:small redox-active disulfide protein 2